MKDNQTLSDKIINEMERTSFASTDLDDFNIIKVKDVKEFIRKLKEEMRINPMSIAIIDNLAGKDLIDSPQTKPKEKVITSDARGHDSLGNRFKTEDKEPEEGITSRSSGSDDICECGHEERIHIIRGKREVCYHIDCRCEQFKKEQGT